MLKVYGWLMGALFTGLLCCASNSQAAAIYAVASSGTTANTNNFPAAEAPPNAVDGSTATKYLNFAKLDTGYILSRGSPSVATGLTLSTANDSAPRDPTSYNLYGSNTVTAIATAGTTYNLTDFTLISTGLLAPPAARLTAYPGVSFANATPYNTYLLVFPTVSDPVSANSMQISEANITGVPTSGGVIAGVGPAVPEPASMAIIGLSAASLLVRRRRQA